MEKLSKILKIVVAAATLLLLAYLAWSCIDVYLSGNAAGNLSDSGVHISPVFSREIAAARLSPMLPWFAFYIVLVAVCTGVGANEKKRPQQKRGANKTSYARPDETGKNLRVLRIALYVLAVLFIVLGVVNGGAGDVLIKAKNICTECIGLG